MVVRTARVEYLAGSVVVEVVAEAKTGRGQKDQPSVA